MISHGHLSKLPRILFIFNSIFPSNNSNTGVRVEKDKVYVYMSNEFCNITRLKHFSYKDEQDDSATKTSIKNLTFSLILDHLLSFNRELINQFNKQIQERVQYLDLVYLQLLYLKYFDMNDAECIKDLTRVVKILSRKRGKHVLFGLKISDWVDLFLARRLRFIEKRYETQKL